MQEGILNELGFIAAQDDTCYISEFKTLYIGVEANEHDLYRSAAATAMRALSKFNYASLKLCQYDINDKDGIFTALVEGFILGAYKFDAYKSDKTQSILNEIIFSSRTLDDEASELSVLNERLIREKIMSIYTNYSREHVNTTP